jgi:hypothetical protein
MPVGLVPTTLAWRHSMKGAGRSKIGPKGLAASPGEPAHPILLPLSFFPALSEADCCIQDPIAITDRPPLIRPYPARC